LLGLLCRPDRIIDRVVSLVAAAEVKGEQFSNLIGTKMIELFECVPYLAVIRPPMKSALDRLKDVPVDIEPIFPLAR